MDGQDVLGQAATGTGKTAAFALPILHQLPEGRRGDRPSALVLVPTRELCVQVSEALHRYGKGRDARCCRSTAASPSTASCASSRAASTSSSRRRDAPSTTCSAARSTSTAVATVVLDEADEMLDMGFADDLEGDLVGGAASRGRPCSSRPRCRLASPRSPARTSPTRCGSRSSASRSRRESPKSQAVRLHRSALAQAGSPRAHPRCRVADRCDRLLPHPCRGRVPRRVAQRSRLPRRGLARRNGPEAA